MSPELQMMILRFLSHKTPHWAYLIKPREISRLVILLCALLIHDTAQAARPSRLLLTTQKWFPFQTYINGQMGGIAINKVKCVLRGMKQPYRITMTDWVQAQLMVKAGEQDGFFIATRTHSRDQYATMSAPLVAHDWYLYFSDTVTDTRITPTNKLRWKVSAQFGTAKWYDLHQEGFQVIKKPRNAKTLMNMLLKNEVDAILADKQAMTRTLQLAHLSPTRFRSRLLGTKKMGVYFRNSFLTQYPGFLKDFNQAVPACIPDGL